MAYAPLDTRAATVTRIMQDNAQAPLTWDDIAAFRATWQGNLVLKGILHPQDASHAAAMGVDGIIVSNHGGRQHDRRPNPLDVRPDIVTAAAEQLVIMIDGGITRGTDVLIALALGAKFAFTGHSTLWGLSAAGLPGVRRVIAILATEIDNALTQTGHLSITSLAHDALQPTPARNTNTPRHA